MNSISVNSEVLINYPDSFELMDNEQIKMAFRDDNPDRWAAWDRENHVIITVGWKKYGFLTSLLADVKNIVVNNEALVEQQYEGRNFKLKGYNDRKIGGHKASGYRFEYDFEDVHQYGQIYLVKNGQTIYAIGCYARDEHEKEFGELLDGITLRKQ